MQALDGLRGIAVLTVIFHHCVYFPSSDTFGRTINSVLQSGRLGVAIFFVLSGFLMGLVVFQSGPRFAWHSYTVKRAGRIYPPFVLSVAFAACLWTAQHGQIHEVAKTCWLYLTTAANFTSVPAHINSAYWSLLVEIHFYAALPVAYLLIRRIFKYPGIITCALFALAPIGMRLFHYVSNPSTTRGWNGFPTVFPERFDAFFFGLVFALLFLNPRYKAALTMHAPRAFWAGTLLMLGIFLAYAATFILPIAVEADRPSIFLEFTYFGIELATFLMLFIVFRPDSFGSRILSNRMLGFFGLISYEWYLFHMPMVHWFKTHDYFDGFIGYSIRVLIPLIGSLAIAVLVYFRFSAPLLRGIRSSVKRKPVDQCCSTLAPP